MYAPKEGNQYRPLRKEVRNAFPKILKSIEKALEPYVDPLIEPVEIGKEGMVDEGYRLHICALIKLLENRSNHQTKNDINKCVLSEEFTIQNNKGK
ncbi:hypothetical protein [Candidatus Liberibacter asiaticus]|nr:hypothetical protein [Candidatus Liberibacter asiaticus]MCU7488412.1 hypothetical protein [Candidatus Liberibacter asiaticus]MCU7489444.1 hypothetical protein [Candidatus Liberibacter asiaticus]WCM58357.1 hypothetical protein NLY32_05015 [Candidatus Liberibacter asiaticus]WLD01311.1 hypothetical protein PY728_05055 [Candidatus Liberibacter asiaticus]